MRELLSTAITPDWEGLISCIRCDKTPARTHHIELLLDEEVQDAVCASFTLLEGLDQEDPYFSEKRQIRLQRFLGYDYVTVCPENSESFLHHYDSTEDTANLKRSEGRVFIDEHRDPITDWDEFDSYPWPDPRDFTTRSLEYYQENLPDDMCIIGGLVGSYAENITWLIGYERLCYALYDQRDLVQAIADKLTEIFRATVQMILRFDRVKAIWGSDDMGFRTGTFISPEDLRTFVLPGHKALAEMAHDGGHPYFLHSCGRIDRVTEDLIEGVGIDAKHSFEDTIESVVEFTKKYGRRILPGHGQLGGQLHSSGGLSHDAR
ncbi:MAG: hypothetical protein JXB06_04540 [Spirochaetales bacterium]|nr:hypothetical protein [Spirochaetales bacterium]